MTVDYSSEFCRDLKSRFEQLGLYRPGHIGRYEPGDELFYDFEPLAGSDKVRVKLVIENFIGGGFAGQVYKIKILEISNPQLCGDLQIGKICAMKILIPPSGFSRLFRDVLYRIGFGGKFQLQVNPTAAKAGALWQKFIRRAAKIKFGNENFVVDIYGIFVDNQMGSCGELSEWIAGRTWRLEVDDHVGLLSKWKRKKNINLQKVGSPEYRAKYVFMHEFVEMLHEVGAHEFARQYEWTTLKSQPNCLKRLETGNEPDKGLVAVDFRAGLALLACLPMSPGDVKLIFQGLSRGSLVQFDRGDLNTLRKFIDKNAEQFSDMRQMFDRLVAADDIYRNSVPDITHNHIRLLYNKKLWSTMFDSAVVGFKTENIIDERGFEKLAAGRFKTFLFLLIGLLPILGRVLRKFFYHNNWRRHYTSMLSSFDYLKKSIKGKFIELLIAWHRAGRISQEKGEKLLAAPYSILPYLPFSLLPAGLHRFFTDWSFAKEKLYFFTVRPVKLYFNSEMRRQWLLDMVVQGQKKHILTDDDAQTIRSQVDEPYIQTYLKSLAVHVCTLPITQIVSVAIACIYWLMHPDMPTSDRSLAVGAILLVFQITPISPGSLTRGFYVVYMAIKDKSFKDYNIAIFLGFCKYIGYLAFPIQMTYRYPAMARFMAAHWATDAVHIVPVFGERGALFEHFIFCVFYNWPLTIRRKMQARAVLREKLTQRFWHIIPVSILTAIALAPFANHLKPATAVAAILCGALTTIYCGKAPLLKRVSAAAVSGLLTAVFYTIIITMFISHIPISKAIVPAVWLCFGSALISVIGAILTELSLDDIENKGGQF